VDEEGGYRTKGRTTEERHVNELTVEVFLNVVEKTGRLFLERLEATANNAICPLKEVLFQCVRFGRKRLMS